MPCGLCFSIGLRPPATHGPMVAALWCARCMAWFLFRGVRWVPSEFAPWRGEDAKAIRGMMDMGKEIAAEIATDAKNMALEVGHQV